jgi:Ohr subfamily peroxiredoxin
MAILATETASATAGREGKATSADGKINLQISPPGSHGPGTNPEQLFAAGYSACFGGAIGAAASLAKIPLKMADIKVTTTVRLHKDDDGFHIDASLNCAGGRRSREGGSAHREGPHDLPILESDAREYRGEAAGKREGDRRLITYE